ncbi:hypothetical protein SLEP1_g57791, partial [Rubroshorea leprosula]
TILIGGYPTSNIPENEGLNTDNSHELHSLYESDDDGTSKRRYPEFNESVDMEKLKLVVGMLFKDRELLKQAIKQEARMNRVEVKFEKNDKKRVKAICKEENCPWEMRASLADCKADQDTTWQIKTLKYGHNCGKKTENKNFSAQWLAEHYLDNFKIDPNWAPCALQAQAVTETGWKFQETILARGGGKAPLEVSQCRLYDEL